MDIKIREVIRDAAVVNRRENILKWKPSDYTEFDSTYKIFQPYNRVWQISNDFQLITTTIEGSLSSIDREQLTEEVLGSWTELVKLEKGAFKSIPHMKYLSSQIRKVYE